MTAILAGGAAMSAPDPYVWLEDVNGPRAMAWVHAENDKTTTVLEKDPRYDALYADALAIAQAKDRIPNPTTLNGGNIYNFWQDADHVHGIWRRTSLADYKVAEPHWQTILDLDALSTAEKANWFYKGADCVEPSQKRCMIALSDGGEDAVTLREFDLDSGKFVEGGFVLPHGKQQSAWEDENTLLVAREWQKGDLTASGYPFIVKRVVRGESLAAAKEIFRGTAKDGGYGVSPVSLHDGDGHEIVIINRPLTTFESENYLVTKTRVERLGLPLKQTVQALVSGALVVSIDQDWNAGGTRIAQGTLVAFDLRDINADPNHLKPTVLYAPGLRESFQAAAATRDALVVTTLNNVRGEAFIYRRDADGAWSHARLAVPENSSIGLVDSDIHGDTAFLSVAGFLQPSSLALVNVADRSLQTVKTLPAKFDASRDVVEQFEAASTDGTKIPYFVVHPKDMKLDGNNPTILYAYGGFQVSETPSYSANIGKLWLEKGGVFVLANIRGGGEFGPAWHEAGLKTKRQIIYDDFASVARDLIARKITSPRRLGIQGGSNGGLLMGVEFTQHPELWRAVDIQVPLLDMLRFEKIAAGTSWVGEYGSVSVPAERTFLAKISPYNNIRKGTDYPKPLIWTTTKDDRVGPQHARKFAARLAEYGIPYLFYEVTEGGHGSGANLKEKAHTTALEMTYFARRLMD
ncbi:MAG TPA: prolyl oligopeptidase family serine peptidase [Rhizomicrobium sp.]